MGVVDIHAVSLFSFLKFCLLLNQDSDNPSSSRYVCALIYSRLSFYNVFVRRIIQFVRVDSCLG